MKLYLSPGACSLSPHIALREAGLDFEVDVVNMKTKETRSGKDFTTINPKGYVPALELDEGGVLTEGAVIVQYIADRKPESKLAPKSGTLERYRLQEWLNYIAAEVHKGFSPLFNPGATDDAKQATRDALAKKFVFLAASLEKKQFLTGDTFTVADAYLFTILNWANFVKIDLSAWPPLKAYVERVSARPAVKAALDAEKALR